MMRKYLSKILVGLAGLALLVGAVWFSVVTPSSPTSLPPGVSTNTPPVPSVTRTATPKPTPSTVTHTVTRPPSPDARTINPPPPVSTGCEQNGLNTADWNTDRDNPSAAELELEPGTQLVYPMVDAPLVGVSAWSNECFDTVMFTIDTTLIPNVGDPEVGDRMWFDGNYETVTGSDGYSVELVGNADLRLTISAPGDSWRYGEADRPVQPVIVGGLHRPLSENLSVIRELKGVEDFEGQVVFGIGVDEKRPFAVHFAESDGKTAVVLRVAKS